MSSQLANAVSPGLWRSAVVGLGAAIGLTLLAAGLIARSASPIDPVRFDDRWQIQSGLLESGQLVLKPAVRFASIALALHPIESMTYTLQARVTIDPGQAAAGLIVHAENSSHFLAFLISDDGYFALGEMRDGVWIERVPWRTWPHIRRDAESNLLRAECDASACTFFVNDEWTWREENPQGGQAIGFLARQAAMDLTAVAVSFSQISIQAHP